MNQLIGKDADRNGRAHLRIAVTNGRILAALALLEGALAGWGFAQRESKPSLAAVMMVGGILVFFFLQWAYGRSLGLFDSLKKRDAP